jgi:hypothetical protein
MRGLDLTPSGAIIPGVNKAEKLDELVGSVEELLARLPEGLSPQIMALRDQVDDGIFDAWKSISSERLQAAHVSSRIVPLTLSAVVGLTILLAFSARLLINRTRHSSRRQVR